MSNKHATRNLHEKTIIYCIWSSIGVQTVQNLCTLLTVHLYTESTCYKASSIYIVYNLTTQVYQVYHNLNNMAHNTFTYIKYKY